MTDLPISARAVAARVEPRDAPSVKERLTALAVMCETLAEAQDRFAMGATGRIKSAYHRDLASRLRIEAANMRLRIERAR